LKIAADFCLPIEPPESSLIPAVLFFLAATGNWQAAVDQGNAFRLVRSEHYRSRYA
jgi:hypothetical protein